MKLTRLLLAVLLLSLNGLGHAEDAPALSKGQTLYLPIYSHLWHGDVKDGYPAKAQLSALVSVRNTDPKQSIHLLSARYYDTAGKLIGEYVSVPKIIGPLGTYEVYVEKREAAGGSGANFLIAWQAEGAVNPPVVEAVHADILGHKTLTFVTTARPVDPSRLK